MSVRSATRRFGPRETLASVIYFAALLSLLVFVCGMLSDLRDDLASLAESQETLDHLGLPSPGGAEGVASAGKTAPFLRGKTITVAGADLQERVETAVRNAGGVVTSSQIDLQVPRAAEGFVGLEENLEIEQDGLQPLLYDLEAGIPYLFVESLAIQSPLGFGESEGARMRVTIGVSGQWREIE